MPFFQLHTNRTAFVQLDSVVCIPVPLFSGKREAKRLKVISSFIPFVCYKYTYKNVYNAIALTYFIR